MGKSLRISGVQMQVTTDVAENEQCIVSAIGRAAAAGADFLLTPEGALSGYRPRFDREEVAAAVARVATAAREAHVGLALGTCYKEREDGQEFCYNQVRLYSPDGQYLGFHGKVLRCSSLWHPGTGEMSDYVEGTLRVFDWSGVRLGLLVCNDLWATPRWTTMPNPYLPWQLRRMGAQLILHAVHSGNDMKHRPFHESSTELWARALEIPIVQVNVAFADGSPVNASSGAVNASGERFLVVPNIGEQFFTCDIETG